jgi:O-antigen/teichoic acid export membrane protein
MTEEVTASQSNNKRIAKNTMFLYFRMIFNMGVSLFTSRVILQTLGVQDFGIYNIVGGVVVLFSFLNGAMSRSTQRYINIAIARDSTQYTNKVFSVSMKIHIIISLVVFFLSETIGLWFLNYKLNIPLERLDAANWVYQISILTTIIDILRIPYVGTILAYEKMSLYAYLGIFETLMKLIIVYLLVFFIQYDSLVIYSFLLFVVNLIVNFIYASFCRIRYNEETKLKHYKDKPLFKEIIGFSGWNLFGQTALVGANQGVNMILNIFAGVTINAAVGIANQVNSAVYSFVSNFQVAFNPQIVQSYAKQEIENHKKLIFRSSKFSFFLIAILAIPILAYTQSILHLWLGQILPSYVIPFTQLIILNSIIEALIGPFWMSVAAVGNIKRYQIVISIFIILNLPVAYVILYWGFSPVYVMASKFILSIITMIYRIYYSTVELAITIKEIGSYLKNILFIFLYLLLITFFSEMFISSWILFISQVLILEIILFILIYFIGTSNNEKDQLKKMIYEKIISRK